ncbi:MAG: hypothetical protein L7F78_19405, partial [Syntrophales bacterium LBB04]|nr:hypothetical protein [Syntrophales bacterium LBB04]
SPSQAAFLGENRGEYGRFAALWREIEEVKAKNIASSSWLGSIMTLPDSAGCTPSPTALCLNNNRFQVQVHWRNYNDGSTGVGHAVPIPAGTGESGYFWFFNQENIELMIKILDGRSSNGKFWVIYGSLSDVEYTLSILDTQTGQTKSYFNPAYHFGGKIDVQAF